MSPEPQSRLYPGDDLLLDAVKNHLLDLEKNASCDATKVCPVPPSSSEMSSPPRKAAYDEATIRLIFIEMDIDSNGTVTKEEFTQYLRSRPQLQNIMYAGLTSGEQQDSNSDKISPQQLRAMGIKRIIKLYKDIDVNKNGVVCWEEFLGFFRRTGLLLSYMTLDNPRDRMATVLGDDHQQRQVVAKWQRGGAALGVGKQAGWDLLAEQLHSKFLVDQKQAELNTQWAAEKLVQLKEKHAKGKDALSIVTGSLEVFREAAKKEGPRARRHFGAQDSVSQTPRTVDTKKDTKKELALAQDLLAADSHRSLPTVSSTVPVRPSIPESKIVQPEPKTFDAETQELKTIKPEKVVAETNDANPLSSNEPPAERQSLSDPVSVSTPTTQLPPLPCGNWRPKYSPQKSCKSPMRRKGRSYTVSNMSPKKSFQTSPKRSQSRRRITSGRSVSPSKRGQTPRRQAEKPVLVDQSWFALDN